MRVSLIFFALCFSFSCQKETSIKEVADLLNIEFTENVRIDGHQFDGILIENCTFDGATLSIGNVDSVVIRNCTFKNIKRNGLKVGFIGPTEGTNIEDCSFENIGFNAIDSHEDALNGIIKGCTFKDVALSEIGPAMAQAHHAIYWKGKNVRIEQNIFEAGKQSFGNAISVRSSGVIRNNIISGSPKNGIMYYSNHPGGSLLLIENNFLINNAYSITCATLGTEEWHNDKVIIRFNSMIQDENESIYIAEQFRSTTEFSVYANIIVNPTRSYFRTFYDVSGIQHNLTREGDVGFVNVEANDLHLLPESEGIDFYAAGMDYPPNDIDGDLRVDPLVNAGADE